MYFPVIKRLNSTNGFGPKNAEAGKRFQNVRPVTNLNLSKWLPSWNTLPSSHYMYIRGLYVFHWERTRCQDVNVMKIQFFVCLN